MLQPSQQKLAEKLTILNDRGVGMLTRLYNIKKVRTGRRGRGGASGLGRAGGQGRPSGWGQRSAPRAEISASARQAGPGVAGMRRGLNAGAYPSGARAGRSRREKPFPRAPRSEPAPGLARGEGRRGRPLLCASNLGSGSTGKEGDGWAKFSGGASQESLGGPEPS